MSENLHDIDKLFRDAIEDHGEMPSGKVWEGIDAGLDKSNVVHIKRKYDNLKRIAAILLLLLLSVVGYEIFKTNSTDHNETAGGTNKIPVNTNPGAGNDQNNNGAGNTQAGKAQQSAANTDQSVTASSGQSNNISNAGMDSLNKGKHAEGVSQNTALNPANKKTAAGDAITVKQQAGMVSQDNDRLVSAKENKTKPGNAKPGQEANNDAAGDVLNRRVAGNKSYKSRTRIKVRNPQPETFNDDEPGDNITTEPAAIANTEMHPLKNEKELTLAERINHAIAINENNTAGRQSPDVVARKMRIKKPFHFSITAFAGPQFASNRIKEESKTAYQPSGPGGPPPPRPGRDDHKEQYKDDEQRQSSYAFGVLAAVPLGKKWSVQSGMSYLNKKISFEPKKIYAKQDRDGKVKYVFDCSSGYSYISTKTGTTPAVGDSITVTSSKNTLGYIGVPLSVSYTLSLGKFSIIPNAGAVLNFLTKQSIETELLQGSSKEQQNTDKIQGLKSSYLNATAGLAIEYNVNNRIALSVMPAGNFALTSINNSDAPVKSYPNAFAVSGGIKIKF
ncbi:MAG: hypothetical protein U0V75_12695 [Ferruginibacter sp.]